MMRILPALLILSLATTGCGGDGATRHLVLPQNELESFHDGAWTIQHEPVDRPHSKAPGASPTAPDED